MTIQFVSIIIPAYNQSNYLKQSLESAINQTYACKEIILVDDGSTDNTATIAKSYGDRIQYIYQDNRGLACARNTGIQAAKGELISLLDSDDIWQENYLETMVSLAKKHPEATVYYSSAQCIDTVGKKLPQIVGKNVNYQQDDLYKLLLQGNFLIPSTITMRRQAIIQAGLFDKNLRSLEDWDLWLRLLPNKLFVGTDDILVGYRVHEQSLSANVTGMLNAKRKVVEKYFGIDDGQYSIWSPEKRTAYSGLYRYFLITTIQRSGDWQSGPENLIKSLLIDPTTAFDLNLFYELALGTQPMGYRGSKEKININSNAKEVFNLLENVLNFEGSDKIQHLHRKILGTANFAIGLVAYNIGKKTFARKYFIKAIYYRPRLLMEKRVSGNLIKSYLNETIISFLKNKRASNWHL